MNRRKTIDRITKIGILSALSVILYYIKFNLPAIFPSFLEVNFSMLPALLGTLALGPIDGAIIIIIRFLLKIPSTSTAFVGEVADLTIGLIIVIITGLIYQFNRTKKGGLISLVMAVVLWTTFGVLSNVITIPLYLQMFFKGDINALVGAISVIPGVNASNYMIKYLLVAALPFNGMLAIIVCTMTYFTYKSVSNIFKHDFFDYNKTNSKKKGNVMIMVDSFKGSMSSMVAGNVIKNEIIKKGYNANVMPISDGGEGFLEVFKQIYNLEYFKTNVHDAYFNIHEARYLYNKDNNTAYVELAENCGIAGIPVDKLNPYKASSYGLGEQIKYIIEKHHPQKIIVGIGGSASSDAGSGMTEALGAKFYNENNQIIEYMNNEKLAQVINVDFSDLYYLIQDIEIEIYSDVKNPLLGEKGAVYVFSPQKGAKKEDLPLLEQNVAHYKEIVENNTDNKNINEEGEGAAGGVGFAFNRILKAKMGIGSDKILELIDFKKICETYDIIITGEGKFDSQSMDGKVINGIMNYHPKRLIVVSAISEIIVDNLEVYSIVPNICSKEESMKFPKDYLAKLINEIKF